MKDLKEIITEQISHKYLLKDDENMQNQLKAAKVPDSIINFLIDIDNQKRINSNLSTGDMGVLLLELYKDLKK